MVWWIWLVMGAALLLLEVLTPGGFYLFFFGLSAIAVGALAGLHVAGPLWLQWLMFGALALVSLLVLRRPLMERFHRSTHGATDVDSLVGETCVVKAGIAADGYGQVELRGTTWNARNAGVEPLAAGQRCKVERVEGLVLWVRNP